MIKGRVQGVSFRYWTSGEAAKRGLAGFVRNRAEGAVEAEFHGLLPDVDDMVKACHRGPLTARVDAIDATDVPFQDDLCSFEILPTV